MTDHQLKSLSLEELRSRMASPDLGGSEYQQLRQECLRRAEGWGKLANCAGCTILSIVLLILLTIW